MTPTRILWLGNALFWLILLGFSAFRAQQIFFTDDVAALRLDPARSEAWPPPPVLNVQTPNPFDPTGAPWQTASAPNPQPTKQVHGIIVLPGVGVALTNRGVIKVGEALDGGRLHSVRTTGAVLDTPAGPQLLPLPGTNRPSLQELNLDKPLASPSVASKQGKP